MAFLSSLRARILVVALAPGLAFAGAAGVGVSDQWVRSAEMSRVGAAAGTASHGSAQVLDAASQLAQQAGALRQPVGGLLASVRAG